jgi:intein-encoded DNA endonuclease-like protein
MQIKLKNNYLCALIYKNIIMEFNKEFNKDFSKNKIVIQDNEIITNGTVSSLKSINPNVIGAVFNEQNIQVSEINALTIIINQNSKDCQDKINALIQIGADPNQMITYYGRKTCAKEIAASCKNIII